MLVTAFVYWKMESPADAYWMMPLMGAAQLACLRGICDLSPGIVSEPAPKHRDFILL